MKTTLTEILKQITPLPWSTPHFALTQEHWDKLRSEWGSKGLDNGVVKSWPGCQCGYILCDSLMGAIATVHKGDCKNEGDDPVGAAADSNAIYLAHCANIFPELVRAINRVLETRQIDCDGMALSKSHYTR